MDHLWGSRQSTPENSYCPSEISRRRSHISAYRADCPGGEHHTVLAESHAEPEDLIAVITVLVADTQPLFGEVIACALDAEDGLVALAERPDRGDAALEAVRRHTPDVVVYDNAMLGTDGPAATRAISSFAPATKVLITSWFHSTDHIRAALAAGAAGFVPKSLRVAQLTQAVRRAAAGEPLVFAEQLAGLIDDLEERWDRSVGRYERCASLTPRELQVLQVLADGRGPLEVAEELSISAGTLKNHVHKILAKTGARTQTEAVAMARATGFITTVRRRRGAVSDGSAQQGAPARTSLSAPRRGDGRISVLVADTQRLFSDALASCLARAHGLSVIPALPTRAGEALDAVVRLRPDVVVYDLNLRDMEGTAAVRALSRWAPATGVILLSWYHGRPQVRKALAAAPEIIVPKTVTVEALAEAVRRVGERDAAARTADLGDLLDLLDGGHLGTKGLDNLLDLTPREVQVLQQLAKGLPLKETASELCLAVGTVKNLTSRLMSKLGVRTQLEAITMAREAGFLW